MLCLWGLLLEFGVPGCCVGFGSLLKVVYDYRVYLVVFVLEVVCAIIVPWLVRLGFVGYSRLVWCLIWLIWVGFLLVVVWWCGGCCVRMLVCVWFD